MNYLIPEDGALLRQLVKVYRATSVPCVLLCLAVAVLVGCGSSETPSSSSVELAVVGQTVTKVRSVGNQVVLLEERLTSIFEDGPQRTLGTLQSDGRTVRYYTPPTG